MMSKHILVVDDNPINQMVLKVILNNWRNTIASFANNGAEGLEVLRNHSIDLVLMDLQMPVMDGFEATIAIRNKEAGSQNALVPIIAVTTDEMETTRQKVMDIGMNDFMNKPVDHNTLFQKVKMLLS